jgi:hypothetical protein
LNVWGVAELGRSNPFLSPSLSTTKTLSNLHNVLQKEFACLEKTLQTLGR